MTAAEDPAWEQCKNLLATRIGDDDRIAWLGNLELMQLSRERVVLGGVPNSFFKSRIQNHFKDILLECLAQCFPRENLTGQARLELILQGPSSTLHAGSPSQQISPDFKPPLQPADFGARGPLPGQQISPERVFAFENFLAGGLNREALQIAQSVTDQGVTEFNPLMLYGPPGSGKSHLLQAIAAGLRQRFPAERISVFSAEAFRNEVLEAIRQRNMKPLRSRYRNAQALLLDGLDVLDNTPRGQEELLHTVDHVLQSGGQCVFTAHQPPRRLAGFSAGLRSRLEMGLILEIKAADQTVGRALVERHCLGAGLSLSQDGIQLLASSITGDLRRLRGALIRLTAHAGLHGGSLGVQELADLLSPYFDPPATPLRPALTTDVLSAVCAYAGTTLKALRSPSRNSSLVQARSLAVYLLRELTPLSYPEIGALLGRRSHSTVLHAQRKFSGHLAADQQLRLNVDDLKRHLREKVR